MSILDRVSACFNIHSEYLTDFQYNCSSQDFHHVTLPLAGNMKWQSWSFSLLCPQLPLSTIQSEWHFQLLTTAPSDSMNQLTRNSKTSWFMTTISECMRKCFWLITILKCLVDKHLMVPWHKTVDRWLNEKTVGTFRGCFHFLMWHFCTFSEEKPGTS